MCSQKAIFIQEEKAIAVTDRERCIGCGLCVYEYPMNLIELVPAGTKIAVLCNYMPLRDIPYREKYDAGRIHYRKCFGVCESETIEWDKETSIPQFDTGKCTLCRKCIDLYESKMLPDFTEKESRARLEPTKFCK